MDLTGFTINPPIIAHRGASAYAPENILLTFREAKLLGAKWIEFDVMLVASGEVVVIHDVTVDRTTDGTGPVSSYLYSDLKKLDAGSWFSPAFAGAEIPTLDQVIALAQEYDLCANIEIKCVPGEEEKTAKAVIALLDQQWKKEKSRLLLSSFSEKILYCVRAQTTDYFLGLLLDEWTPSWQKDSDALGCVSIGVDHLIINQEKIDIIHASKRLVLCYTVNTVERAKQLFTMGIDGVFTDCPDKILAWYDRGHLTKSEGSG